ncbi:MAG: type II toxin-antitoxin system RelE/ParE family toxin [Angelakisella sp.]
MTSIKISPRAFQDLSEIKAYITEELESPNSASETVRKILKRISELEAFPETGTKLSCRIRTETSYRYVTSGSYLAFYRYEDEIIFVDRILYGKRDYLKVLFTEIQEP